MKLSIKTITITFEGVEFTDDSTTQYRADTQPDLSEVLPSKMVADNDLNRENPFWRDYIGKQVLIVRDHGVYLDVQLDDQPVPAQGVDPKRFT